MLWQCIYDNYSIHSRPMIQFIQSKTNKQTKQSNVKNLARIMSRHLIVMKQPLKMKMKMTMIPTSIVSIVVTRLVAICEFLIQRFFHHSSVCCAYWRFMIFARWFTYLLSSLLAFWKHLSFVRSFVVIAPFETSLFAPFLVQLFISVALFI